MEGTVTVEELRSLLHVRQLKAGCWLAGVARPLVGVSTRRAYQVLYQAKHGTLPERLVRTCDEARCVNPDHRRPWLKGYCKLGLHDLRDSSNVRMNVNGNRQCRVCELEQKRRSAAEWEGRLKVDPNAAWRDRRSKAWRATRAATKAAEAAKAESKIVSLDERRAG